MGSMDRTSVEILFRVKNVEGEVVHETSLQYHNLPYSGLVAMEKILAESGQKLASLGDQQLKEQKGKK